MVISFSRAGQKDLLLIRPEKDELQAIPGERECVWEGGESDRYQIVEKILQRQIESNLV